ncbi:MAG: DUF2147 domain-containing protein [Hyphomicrobium sp.]
MRFDRNALRGAAVVGALLAATAAHAENSATGLWIDHTGRGAVEITDCGGKLCGHVAWVEDAKNDGECGKQIIGNVKPVGKNKWDNGWIYDPDRDSKYDVELTLLSPDKLKVTGYAGSKWFSESYTWKRAPADLQKCGSSGDAAAAAPAPTTEEPATKAARADEPSSEPTKRSDDDVQLDATKPDSDRADTAKSDAPKSDTPKSKRHDDDETATAEPDADPAGDEPKGKKKDVGKVLSRIMEQLGDGDGPIKVKRTGKTCKVAVPYMDMVVSVPCDDKD